MKNTKIKVNDKCHCGSNIKYKKCCMNISINNQHVQHTQNVQNMQNSQNNQINEHTKWTITQSVNSIKITQVINILQPEFENICIIDITDNLNDTTYETYQKKNYYTNIMMIAERTNENNDVFEKRSNSELSNIIVMYHGAYRTFSLNNLVTRTDYIIEAINQML